MRYSQGVKIPTCTNAGSLFLLLRTVKRGVGTDDCMSLRNQFLERRRTLTWPVRSPYHWQQIVNMTATIIVMRIHPISLCSECGEQPFAQNWMYSPWVVMKASCKAREISSAARGMRSYIVSFSTSTVYRRLLLRHIREISITTAFRN